MFTFNNVNVNPETGIHYGAISGHSLDPDILNDIQDKVFDLEYQAAYKDHLKNLLQDVICDSDDLTIQQMIDKCEAHDIDPDLDYFAEDFDCSEPSGTVNHEGLIVTFTWLGGAPLIIVNESPFITFANPCSPCVPNAGDLDNLDPEGIECYAVPENWKADFYD